MIVCGLEDIHKLKICHRDLKPGNILFTEDYKVRIADFGEAKMFEDLQKQKSKIQNDYDRNFGNRLMKQAKEHGGEPVMMSIGSASIDFMLQEENSVEEHEFFQKMFQGTQQVDLYGSYTSASGMLPQ